MSAQPPSERELQSWKEIAAYLGVSIRTAQNWEKLHGLPLVRLPGERGRPVASARELDAWKRQSAGNGVLEPAQPPQSAFQPQQLAERESAPRQDPDLESTPAGPNGLPATPRRFWPRLLIGAALVLVGAIVVAGVTRSLRGSDATGVQLVGGNLVAWGAEGREAWRKSFSPPLVLRQYAHHAQAAAMLWTGDLDGDGKNETLFAAVTEPDFAGDLICYSSTGRELWRYRPKLSLRTMVSEVPDVWAPVCVTAGRTSPAGPFKVWVGFTNSHSSPGVVVRLSSQGVAEAQYVHSGHLHFLRLWNRAAGTKPVLLAGGINNRRAMATLVVLDPDRLAGVSAEPGCKAEQLEGPLSQSEIARVFFSRTQASRELAPYNEVHSLELANGHLLVETDESMSDPGPEDLVVRYELDANFGVVNVRFADVYGPNLHHWFLERRVSADFDPDEVRRLRAGYMVERGEAGEDQETARVKAVNPAPPR